MKLKSLDRIISENIRARLSQLTNINAAWKITDLYKLKDKMRENRSKKQREREREKGVLPFLLEREELAEESFRFPKKSNIAQLITTPLLNLSRRCLTSQWLEDLALSGLDLVQSFF